MKRSIINKIMRQAEDFLAERRFILPPFAYWSPDQWAQRGMEAREIVENRLGWDITDFGRGDFDRFGLFLFTIRNGNPANITSGRGKLYCEKILITQPEQMTPMHFHWHKMEDIINRGGGQLFLRLYNAAADEELDRETEVVVATDGVLRTVPAGGVVELSPGESITLTPRVYHEFWSDRMTLLGEVSLVNDDYNDNRFAEPIGRFPQVEEDEPPLHLLVNDYEQYAPQVAKTASGG